MKRFALYAALFAAMTVVMTWPLASDPGHLVPDTGDPLLTTWILHWDWWQFFRAPIHLFDAGIFHPARLALAFSENLFGVSALGFPLYFGGLAPLGVYNVLFLVGMALSGFAMWALAAEVTGDPRASVAAGVFYAFVPFRFDHLSHIQMQWGGFIPLALLFLFRFFRTETSRDLTLFALFFAWNALTSVYLAIFGAFAVAATLILELNRTPARRSATIPRLTRAVVIGSACVVPFYVPYLVASRLYHFRRSVAEASAYRASLKAFLSAGFRNKLYGALTARFAGAEGQLFPGLWIILLTLVGVVFLLRSSPVSPEAGTRRSAPKWLDALILLLGTMRLALFFTGKIALGRLLRIHDPSRLSMLLAIAVVIRLSLAFPGRSRYRDLGDFLRRNPLRAEGTWAASLVLLGVLIAFGPRLFFYRVLYDMFPFVLGAIRGTARGVVIAHIGLSVLAAFGVSAIARRFPTYRIPALFACSVILLFELRAAPLSLVRADAAPTPAARWLASRSFDGGVLELPMTLEDNFEYVYRVTQHHHPILNGYSGFFPPDFVDLQNRFAENPVAPGTMAQIRRMDARLVVFHADRATTDELVSIPNFLRDQKHVGSLKAAAYFHDRRDTSLVFEIPSAAPIATAPEAAAAEKSIDAFLANPGEAATPPYGWFDTPVGPIFRGGVVNGAGWAASDSGIDRIEISIDGRTAGRATYGFSRPDVLAAKPKVPCKGVCGYRYRVVNVPPGRHVLSTRFVGNNGKDVTLPAAEIWMRP